MKLRIATYNIHKGVTSFGGRRAFMLSSKHWCS